MTSITNEYSQRKRSFNIRCVKYALVSLTMIIVSVVLAGCTYFLFGSEKIAYERIVAASKYYSRPSTIRIESGTVENGVLYCVISAYNSYGYKKTDCTRITNWGIPDDVYYDSRCYKSDLNVSKINEALRNYFSGKQTTITDLPTSTIVLMAAAAVVLLCLNGLLASKASTVAMEKGYDKRTWFHMCFWLGLFSYILIMAMPDRVMHERLDGINTELARIAE